MGMAQERRLLTDQSGLDAFAEFVSINQGRLRHALTAALGYDTGQEAAAEALAHGWEHWEKVRVMSNPVGYLYTVGRSKGRRALFSSRRPVFPPVPEDRTPLCEPGLPAALSALREKERVVVMLVHGYGWKLTEVADTLGVSRSTVQTHAERGMRKLRQTLGVKL